MSAKADLTASPDDETKPTMTGAVPLVPLGRPQLAAAARLAAGAARHPVRLAGAGLRLTGELASAARGQARREPLPGDRRFTDPAWSQNPLYRRVLQGYLGATAVADATVGRLGLDDKSEGRARFVVGQVSDALAPTNSLLGNPAALRKAAATKGASLGKGARALAGDVLHNGAMPQTVDRRPFRLGETVATSPGAVVLRTEVFELLQYKPATPTVGKVPVVFIPPEISRHYILDLSPGRSLVEFLVAQGHQVFIVSWRNPTAEHRDWNLDTYVAASLEGVTTAALISGSPDVHLVGACAGGITAAALAGHLAATGERRIRTLTFLVTVLDTGAETMASLFLSEWSAALAVRGSKRTGVLKGRQLTRMFAWMRPNDL
ncbi:MAG: poly[(R)-3-hydroxyalkanoate] polymerase subunit PhaC, partial [Actinomycetota bacterium]|nr:poly[(R)-3-hydroxyalkanoate] polymerase subunit PhaC [Actinomycetota bacterium]